MVCSRPVAFDGTSDMWRNRRHDVVLHFESEDTGHRLIDALLGERPIPERLFERGKIVSHFPDAGSSKNHIVTGFDGEHHGLREVPLRINACHVERIGHDHAIIAQLLAQDLRDERIRELCRHHRINGRH